MTQLLILFSFRSEWDVRKTPEQSAGMSFTPEVSSSSNPTSRSTDCLDLDAACAGMRHCISDVTDAHNAPKLHCECQPVRQVRHREKMRKYHAVIRLNSMNSNSDLSTLDLANIDESQNELDFVLNVSAGDVGTIGHPNLYYTIDSRRLASKHKKSQHDR